MLRSLVLVLVALLLVTSLAGCLKQDPSLASPISAYPKIKVDFVDNVTKIYVEAISDLRYSNITIRAFHGNVTYESVAENNTYSLHLTIKQREFTLNVTATDTNKNKIKKYAFEGDFTVQPVSEPDIIMRVSIDNPEGSPKVYKLQESDLPWSRIGERFK
jgi:hypothetical protein